MSNVLEFESHSTVERQAREWLVRLDSNEPLSLAERNALQSWLNHSGSHRKELTRLAKFWQQANVLTELAVPLQRVRPWIPGISSWVFRAAWASACGIIVAVVVGVWWLYFAEGANRLYTTAIGAQRVIALRDGSSIDLNTDTQVRVDYTHGLRHVQLLKGEALFKVTQDPARPFEVEAGNRIVRAVGTAFSVQLDGAAVNVTVAHGVVAVSELLGATSSDAKPDEAALKVASQRRELGRIKAGEATTLTEETPELHTQLLGTPELDRRMAWQQGFLVFSGQPLSELVRQVNRYSPVALELSDPSLESIAIGGRFRVGDLDAVLEVLRENFGIDSTRLDSRTIRLARARSR